MERKILYHEYNQDVSSDNIEDGELEKEMALIALSVGKSFDNLLVEFQLFFREAWMVSARPRTLRRNTFINPRDSRRYTLLEICSMMILA